MSPVVFRTRQRLAFVLGAFVAALFPLTYLALIPLTAWAVYRFGVASDAAWFYSPIFSTTLLLAGCLLILSLLKPLVAAPAPASEPRYLNPDRQPLLFALVRLLAAKIGVAPPERIAVDCNVNSYCMFAGGLPGAFRSGFVLVIGLPLVAGLRLDQVIGVLAHELGHALQLTTMRACRVIWAVHAWLSRVASQEDEFDVMLQARLGTASHPTRLVLRLAQLLIQVSRGILWLLWVTEGAVTAAFRRRIEIEADRCQIRASGSDRFVDAVLEINLLSLAAQRAIVELSRTRRTGRLVDDYPALIVRIRAGYPADFVQRLRAGLEQAKTRIFSAYLCDNDRIALARAEHQQGIVTADLPGSALFEEFQNLCRNVTVDYYEQELGLTGKPCKLVPVATLLE